MRLLAAFDHCNQHLQVQVIDYGKGVSTEKLETIHELLESKDEHVFSTTEASGLLFCKKVVEKNEGKIFLCSEGLCMGTTV